jgi:hypothetical protein
LLHVRGQFNIINPINIFLPLLLLHLHLKSLLGLLFLASLLNSCDIFLCLITLFLRLCRMEITFLISFKSFFKFIVSQQVSRTLSLLRVALNLLKRLLPRHLFTRQFLLLKPHIDLVLTLLLLLSLETGLLLSVKFLCISLFYFFIIISLDLLMLGQFSLSFYVLLADHGLLFKVTSFVCHFSFLFLMIVLHSFDLDQS